MNRSPLAGFQPLGDTGTIALSAGDTLKLFSATSCSGIFVSTPSAPGPGLVWDLSGLSSAGTLKVASAPGISQVTLLPNGSATLTLAGPVNQLYDILSATNLALPLSQWQTLTGGVLSLNPVLLNDPATNNYYDPREFFSRSPRQRSSRNCKRLKPFTVLPRSVVTPNDHPPPDYHTPRPRPLIRKFSPSDFRPVRATGVFSESLIAFAQRPVRPGSATCRPHETMSGRDWFPANADLPRALCFGQCRPRSAYHIASRAS